MEFSAVQNIKTLRDLIDALEEQAELLGDDAEVRLATQPNWPFEWTIAGVVSSEDLQRGNDDDEDVPVALESDTAVVWITEGRQIGYAQKRLWEEQ